MSQPLEVVPAGQFCWNEQCPDYGVVAAGNLRRYGKTSMAIPRRRGRFWAATPPTSSART